MSKFDIKQFLTENKVTEVAQIEDIRKRLDEYGGSETKEGKEILQYFENKLGMDESGKETLINNLNEATPASLRSVYQRVLDWKDEDYKVTENDFKIVNSTLER